jgi:hypothetical protein
MENRKELLNSLEYPNPWEETVRVWEDMEEMFEFIKKPITHVMTFKCVKKLEKERWTPL